MATAISDNNGFIEIKDNKLSKPGVFEYLGSEIGAEQPDVIYNVFRPPEELADPECVNSFKLQPWVIDHQMLGKNYDSPAELKGIHGVIGEDVYYDESDKYLKGNIKIYSDELEDAIAGGKDELSLGFSCIYEFGKSGIYDGKAYNVIQRRIRGNHLASVDESRMDVAVMDEQHKYAMDQKFTITLTDEVMKMDEKAKAKSAEGTGQDQEKTMSEMMGLMKEMMPMMAEFSKMMAMMTDMGNGTYSADKYHDENSDVPNLSDREEGMDDDNDDKDDKKEGMDGNKDKSNDTNANGSGGMDAAAFKSIVTDAIKPVVDKVNALEKKTAAMDASTIAKQFSERDTLAATLSKFVGTFDHSSKTLQEVAEYGVEQLKVPCQKGEEVKTLNAYLHDRRPPSEAKLFYTGQDGSEKVESVVDKYTKGGNQ